MQMLEDTSDIKHRLGLSVGDRSGRIVITSIGPREKIRKCTVRCECGTDWTIRCGNFKRTRSCGCYHNGACGRTTRIHGTKRRSPEYSVWINMRLRCYHEKAAGYSHYGGRGIKVCDRWLYGEDGLRGFPCFLADMGKRPSDDHSIERLDTNGNYEPKNCCWATQTVQMRNTRRKMVFQWKGRSMKLIDICEMEGARYKFVRERIQRYGFSMERAVTTPSRRKKPRMRA